MSLPAFGILLFIVYTVVFAFLSRIPRDEEAGARLVADDRDD